MGKWRWARVLVTMALGVSALGAGSCAGGAGKPPGMRDGGAGREGGGAGHDGGVAGHDGSSSDAARCPSVGELAAEPTPVQFQVPLDGGVPLDQFLHALAVARCQYLSRCFALSTYVANDCVDQLVNNGSFNYPPGGGSITYLDPSSALAQAATAGDVHYDPHQEAQCLAAQLAEGCAGFDLVVNLPACAHVFTCPTGTDGGAGATDGGAAAGGATCSFYDSPVQTCSTDQDCAGGTGASRSPYCVSGICVTWRCGYFPIMGIDSCTSLAAAGEPCLTNAFSVLDQPGGAGRNVRAGIELPGRDARRRARRLRRAARRGRGVHRRRELQARSRLRLRHLRDPARQRTVLERPVRGGRRLLRPHQQDLPPRSPLGRELRRRRQFVRTWARLRRGLLRLRASELTREGHDVAARCTVGLPCEPTIRAPVREPGDRGRLARNVSGVDRGDGVRRDPAQWRVSRGWGAGSLSAGVRRGGGLRGGWSLPGRGRLALPVVARRDGARLGAGGRRDRRRSLF